MGLIGLLNFEHKNHVQVLKNRVKIENEFDNEMFGMNMI
jgi:hypothetical protein